MQRLPPLCGNYAVLSSIFPLVSVKLQWLVIVFHIWFAMEISIFITHLQIDHYVGGVNWIQ